MKQKYLLFFLPLFISLVAAAQKKSIENTALPRPKLVVGIVVDQMRWDYLYRYYERYGNNGFRRMLKEGFSCENTHINYVPTVTAIGHTSVYTGSIPAIHGITGNDFILQRNGKQQNSTGDTSVRTVGSPSKAGMVSPRNMLTSTITDELRLATNFKSKVIGISIKDRGSVFASGHSANAAYWFDDMTGHWITSTYYMKELPAWAQQLNQRQLPAQYLQQNWKTLYDPVTYRQSIPDNNPYEGRFDGTASPTFPIPTATMYQKNFSILRTTPFANSFTLEMAKAAVKNEQLGNRGVTDFLALSFSATDAVGHKFSVNSVEVEDVYLRLDLELGAFFSFLDQQVGKGQYTVFLTADHGAAHNSGFLKSHNIPAGKWEGPVYEKELNLLLKEKYGSDQLMLSFLNYQVNLNHPVIETRKLNIEAIKKDCIAFLSQKPGVSYILDMQQVQYSSVPEILRSRIVNGYHRDRCGDLQIILNPAWISGYSTGSGHSVWNPYDAHIPLLWMGWGVRQGRTNKVTHITDIAPTLAALLRIQEPNGSVGAPVADVLKDPLL